jgi:hypothetical protein
VKTTKDALENTLSNFSKGLSTCPQEANAVSLKILDRRDAMAFMQQFESCADIINVPRMWSGDQKGAITFAYVAAERLAACRTSEIELTLSTWEENEDLGPLFVFVRESLLAMDEVKFLEPISLS